MMINAKVIIILLSITAAGFLISCGQVANQEVTTTLFPGQISGLTTLEGYDTSASVTISLVGLTQTAATSAEGAYLLANLQPGTYTLEATKSGFESQRQTVVISQTILTAEANFYLIPTSPPPPPFN